MDRQEELSSIEDERELARLRLLANQLRVARMQSLGDLKDERGEW